MKCFVQSNTIDHQALGWAESTPVLSIPKAGAGVSKSAHEFDNLLVVTLPVQVKISSDRLSAEITVRGFSNQSDNSVHVWTSSVAMPSCTGNTYEALNGRPADSSTIHANQNHFRVDPSILRRQPRFEGKVYVECPPDATLAVVHIGLMSAGRWVEDRADVLRVQTVKGGRRFGTQVVKNRDSKVSKSYCFVDR
jgi:hypothetical protein